MSHQLCTSSISFPTSFIIQIEVSPTKQLPLASFRGTCRPVLLVGTRGHLNKCIKAAEAFQAELQARGVALVPIEVNADDPTTRLRDLKAEFRCDAPMKQYLCRVSTLRHV